jgi:hypothetical protein
LCPSPVGDSSVVSDVVVVDPCLHFSNGGDVDETLLARPRPFWERRRIPVVVVSCLD